MTYPRVSSMISFWLRSRAQALPVPNVLPRAWSEFAHAGRFASPFVADQDHAYVVYGPGLVGTLHGPVEDDAGSGDQPVQRSGVRVRFQRDHGRVSIAVDLVPCGQAFKPVNEGVGIVAGHGPERHHHADKFGRARARAFLHHAGDVVAQCLGRHVVNRDPAIGLLCGPEIVPVA